MVTSVVVWVSSNFNGHVALLLDLVPNGSRTVFYWNMVISIDLVFVVLMFWNMISGLGPLSRTEKLVTSGAFYKHAECLTLGTTDDAVTSFQLLYYTPVAGVHEVILFLIRSLRGGRSERNCMSCVTFANVHLRMQVVFRAWSLFPGLLMTKT